MLGAQPTLGVRKGETFRASHGRHVEASTGKWHFGGEWRSPPDLDAQIAELLLALPNDRGLWEELTKQFHCYLSVGAYLLEWTGGLTLAPVTTKLLAERQLPIDFDCPGFGFKPPALAGKGFSPRLG